MFCVVCGKETPDEELRGGECASCYLEQNVLVRLPPTVDVEVCVHCLARKKGEQWLDSHASIEPVVLDAVRDAAAFHQDVAKPRLALDLSMEDERNWTVTARAGGVAAGVPFEETLTTRARLKNATCTRCSRIQGGYYEAVVQVRATKRALEDGEARALVAQARRHVARIQEQGDRNAFILREDRLDGGVDVYVGTTNAGRTLARNIASERGGKLTEHAKTVGQKDGIDLVRMTFAIRLPVYRAGDVALLGDDVVRVTSVGAKTVQVADLRTGRTRHVERGVADARAVTFDADAQRDAVVVSRAADELQLLDPWTFATASVRRPENYPEPGETARVVKHDDELVLVWDPRAS